MAKQQSVIRLILVDDKIDDAQHSINLLRNGGLPLRPSRPESLGELEAALENASGEIILASYSAKVLPFQAVTEVAQASGKDVVVVALLDQLDEEAINTVLSSGARGFALRGRAKYMQYVIEREARIAERRRLVRRLEASLRETERRCDALIASSRDPIAYVHEGMHIRANQAYLEMFGYEDFEEIEGLPLLDMVGAENTEQFKQLLKDLSRGEPPPKNLELKARHSSGETFDALMEFAQASYEGEPCIQIVMRPQLLDAEMVKELDALRQRDQVTGLYNRQHFLGELDDVLAAAAEGASDQALMLMELDNYPVLMSAIGAANADDLLKATSTRIEKLLPPDAIAARFNDHGFAVLLTNSNHADTRELGKTLCAAFADSILEVGQRSLNATLSIGAVQIGQKNASAQQVLNKVVDQLQSAQADGGSRQLVFDPSARDRAEEERIAQWVAHMEGALKGEGFLLHFQPIIHLTGEPEETYQVLLRLTGPSGDVVTPSVFMGIAEENGMMAQIDRWVIQRAIATLAHRKRAGHDTRLFVKITVESLQDPKLAAWIAANLRQAEVPPQSLVLCIPESKASTNLKAVQDLYALLSQLGCGLCLEQFGLGLNSFQILGHVPADYLAIDHALVEDLSKSPENQAKLREIADHAARLDRRTIAEGVQDAASMTILFTSGVDYVYGHFLAPPEREMNFDFNQ